MAETGITYFSKKPIRCPVCDKNFKTEHLRTGRGRLNAGELTSEMRREYKPTKKFGAVYPLAYPIGVCPQCYYAAFPADLEKIDTETRRKLDQDTEKRIIAMKGLFGSPDYDKSRDLLAGACSYYLAMMCYNFFPPEFSPSFKQGLCALRAAWLCGDLHKVAPNENWDYIQTLFYKKARFLYNLALEREGTGDESMAGAGNYGPDTEKNYGYDGVLYIAGLLEYKYGSQKDAEKRRKTLEKAKISIARIHGLGKASKSKPSILLDKVRDLYEIIRDEIKE